MFLIIAALCFVVGAIFATIIVPLAAIASMATAVFGLMWLLF